MNVYGYSERGILNSLLYEILYANDSDKLLSRLIEKAAFPLTDNKPSSGAATVLVDQSLSDFGEADAIILISSNAANCAIFVEAKVLSQSRDWKLSDQLSKFKADLKSIADSSNIDTQKKYKKRLASNMFTQLYHKQRLVSALKDNDTDALHQGIKFPSWSTKPQRKIGKNPVVLRAVDHIQQYTDNVFYLALVPDNDQRVATFFDDTLRNVQLPCVSEWDTSYYGYLTWATVKSFCEQNQLAATLDVFAYNDRQIFSKMRPDQALHRGASQIFGKMRRV